MQLLLLKYIKAILLFAVFFLCFKDTNGQYYSISKQDSLVKVLVKRHIALSQAKKTIPGYRIQIYFGPDRNEALELKSDFEKIYKDVTAHLSYQQPNFKIRVGDFTTRLEAQKFYRDIHLLYSSAFLVKDEILLKELK